MNDPKNAAQPGRGHFAGSTAQRYARELHRYLLRRLKRPQDVDDLAQEVYLRLLRLDEAKCVHNPLAFVYGVAAHVVADFRLRSHAQQAHLTFDEEAVQHWSEQPTDVLPDELGERVALEQHLKWALGQLPPTQAAVLLAHKRDGFSYEEIAQRLKLSIHTVEKYLTQAKAKLRTLSWNR
jgi:RNA polymerase sigma-70 factor (ECF subfamily)